MKNGSIFFPTLTLLLSFTLHSKTTDYSFFYRAGLGTGGSSLHGEGETFDLNGGVQAELGMNAHIADSTFDFAIGRQFNSTDSFYFEPHMVSIYTSASKIVPMTQELDYSFGAKIVWEYHFKTSSGGNEIVEFLPAVGLEGSFRYKLSAEDIIIARLSLIQYEVDRSRISSYSEGETFNGSGIAILFQKHF